MKKEMHLFLNAKRVLLFAMTFLFVICFAGALPAKAEYEQQIRLNSCSSSYGSTISIKASVEGDQYHYIEIYRSEKSPSKGGTFKLLDQMPISGQVWYSDFTSGAYEYAAAEKNKIICYSLEPSVHGDVIFEDTSVAVGHKYYYKIVMKSRYTDTWPTITSNTVSATTKLPAPELTRSYSLDGKTVKLCWNRPGKNKGYQIYKYDGKKWTRLKTITKSSVLTYTDKKVKAGKTYKYKVRAYTTVSNKNVYSAFSSVCTVSLKKPTVSGDYKANSVYGPSLNSKERMEVRRVVQSFKNNYIRKGMSDYDKVLTAFLYLRSNCQYARRGWQYNKANTAWGALVYNEAQCSGFARAMKALCDAIGVKCYYVHANSKASNPSHQWNEVRIDGKWYIVDAQGGFFLVGSQTWKNFAGMRWDTKGLPKCSSRDHKNGGFYQSII